jgi:hypothetical protein
MDNRNNKLAFNIVILILIILVFGLIIYNYFNTPESFMADLAPITETYKFKGKSTIYEKALEDMYGSNKKLMANMLPYMTDDMYLDKGVPIKRDKFPVHIFKEPDSTILAVFNDGAIYRKNTMNTGIWNGPLDNSMPNGGRIPLRMIDNRLYIKRPGIGNELDITQPWERVDNNSDLIYVMNDPYSGKLIGIDSTGSLMIKKTDDITSEFVKLNNLSVKALKIYFDNNGYMLVLDRNFNLWQMMDLDWENSDVDTSKGSNPTRVNDVIYDNDGKLYGLVFPLNAEKLTIMKQGTYYFLSVFLPILKSTTSSDSINFIMNDNSIILSKSGVDYSATEFMNDNELDDDIEHARVVNDMDNTRKLRAFCASKKRDYDPRKMENYELIEDIDNNNKKIAELQSVLNKLKAY